MSEWWRKSLRVLQDNLQVADTGKMDPARIAQETRDLHANALVANMGGIYAWYDTTVPYHHKNEFLPAGDLMGDLIRECHARGIRFIARFDFSKAEDRVFLSRPEWFVREPDASPRSYGATRSGQWSILYGTCINAGYRNRDVAVPVLREVLSRYDIDGVFLNAPNYEYCCCEACREKYWALYGKELPVMEGSGGPYSKKPQPDDLAPDFPGICYRDNIACLHDAIQSVRKDVPLILYFDTNRENIGERLKTCEMICTEAQDVLSRGWRDIPPLWQPTVNMKLGRNQPAGNPKPFGIIHSCPGMDWRHTGLPEAEYRSWLRQVPAAGGTIWHSVTGFGDTITDKRILAAVASVDADTEKIEPDMESASELADCLLLWNGKATGAWAHLLTSTQTQFRVMEQNDLTRDVLPAIPLVIVPNGCPLLPETAELLLEYTRAGGRVLTEGPSAENTRLLQEGLGIESHSTAGEFLRASYWRSEDESIGRDLPPLVPHRGVTRYGKPLPKTRVLASLVPPFAPMEAVGAPPERASLPVEKTDIPLLTLSEFGRGAFAFLPFALSALAEECRLQEHLLLWRNILDAVLRERAFFMEPLRGVIANAYRAEGRILVHLVNAVGERPLTQNIPLSGVKFSVRLPEGAAFSRAARVIAPDGGIDAKVLDGMVRVRLETLDTWEMVRIEYER